MKEIKLVQESFQDYLNENNINLFDNEVQYVYENKTVIKRKYTETHPAKHAYSEAKIRNAVVEFVNSKSQVTEKQMKTFLKKLSETVGKPISRTWLNASKNLFKLEEDNGEMFYKLSNRGNKIFNKIVAIKEGSIVRLKNMELIREDFEFLNGLLGKVEEVEEEIPEEEVEETPSEETSDDESENGKELLSISVGNKKFVIKLFTEEETEDGEEVSQVTVDDENIEPVSDESEEDSEDIDSEEETEESEEFDSEGTVNLQEEFESLGYVPAQPDLLDGKEIGDNYNKMVNFVPKVISKYCDQDLDCPMMWHAEDKKLVAPCSINDTKLLLSSNGNTSDEIKTITICTTDQDGNYITICSDLEGIQPEDLVAIIKKIKGGSFDEEIQQANNVSAQIPEESEKMENEVEENDEDDEPKFESVLHESTRGFFGKIDKDESALYESNDIVLYENNDIKDEIPNMTDEMLIYMAKLISKMKLKSDDDKQVFNALSKEVSKRNLIIENLKESHELDIIKKKTRTLKWEENEEILKRIMQDPYTGKLLDLHASAYEAKAGGKTYVFKTWIKYDFEIVLEENGKVIFSKIYEKNERKQYESDCETILGFNPFK